MSKLVQICASQNDLFALDGEGVVYHYNFHTSNWRRLGDRREENAESCEENAESIVEESAIAQGEAAERRNRSRSNPVQGTR
jgi:hypothetical protein